MMVGKKHIARLKARAASLRARIKASPGQADFADERAELKSLLWIINDWRKAQSELSELRHQAWEHEMARREKHYADNYANEGTNGKPAPQN